MGGVDYVLCDVCGRPFVVGVMSDEELSDWFMVCAVDPPFEVIRCPRHVTRWAFRLAQVPWTNELRKHHAWGVIRDAERYDVLPNSSYPLPMHEDDRRLVMSHYFQETEE